MKREKLPQLIYDYLRDKNETNLVSIQAGNKGSWNLSKMVREVITDSLLISQKHICAYCESRIYSNKDVDIRGNQHIEHIVERHDKPELTYVYTNFTLSCEGGRFRATAKEVNIENSIRVNSISCGHYKTDHFHKNTGVDYTKLLDPFKVEYSDFFEYTEEIIKPKSGLNDKDYIKAVYTLDRFNLNADRLQLARLAVIRQIRKDLMSYKQKAAQKRYITNLIKNTQDIYPPFVSMIRYHFSWVLDIN